MFELIKSFPTILKNATESEVNNDVCLILALELFLVALSMILFPWYVDLLVFIYVVFRLIRTVEKSLAERQKTD